MTDYPDSIDIAVAHGQKAESLSKLGQAEAAIDAYRAALNRERKFPNFGTNAWLDFGWLIVEKELTHLYDEAAQVLVEFHKESNLSFPVLEYQYAAIQAILSDAQGADEHSREFAKKALSQAEKTHSGLRYHPKLGLVGPERAKISNRLRTLADS